MTKTLFFILSSVLILPPLAFAGDGGNSGGGGGAQVCFKTKAWADVAKASLSSPDKAIPLYLLDFRRNDIIKSIETLEIRDMNGSSIIPILPSETPDQYVSRILDRFDQTIPVLSERLRENRDHFNVPGNKKMARLNFHDDIDEPSPPDSNCVYVTMAWQQFGQVYYDPSLYNHPKHSNLSRAAINLHELVRRSTEFTMGGARARGFVELMITPDLTVQTFLDKAVEFGFLEHQGMAVSPPWGNVYLFSNYVENKAKGISYVFDLTLQAAADIDKTAAQLAREFEIDPRVVAVRAQCKKYDIYYTSLDDSSAEIARGLQTAKAWAEYLASQTQNEYRAQEIKVNNSKLAELSEMLPEVQSLQQTRKALLQQSLDAKLSEWMDRIVAAPGIESTLKEVIKGKLADFENSYIDFSYSFLSLQDIQIRYSERPLRHFLQKAFSANFDSIRLDQKIPNG